MEIQNKDYLALKQAYYRMSITDDGKKVLEDIKRFCGYDSISVNEQEPNAMATMYKEGKRRVFLMIQSMIKRDEI
jgi:hypothetical protein